MAKQIKIQTPEQARTQVQKPKTIKVEITMTIEVDNGSVMSKMKSLLHDSVKEAVEGLGSGDVINVTNIHTSQKTFPCAGCISKVCTGCQLS